jgi:hypothetical protein
MTRKIHKPTGYCLNCGKKLKEIDNRKVYCSLSCNEEYYYREVIMPRRRELKRTEGKIPGKRDMINNIAKLLDIFPEDSINATYKAIIKKLQQ